MQAQDSCRPRIHAGFDWLGNFQSASVEVTYGVSSMQFHVRMTISKRPAKDAMGDLSFCDANGLASQLFAQLLEDAGNPTGAVIGCALRLPNPSTLL